MQIKEHDIEDQQLVDSYDRSKLDTYDYHDISREEICIYN